MAAMNALQKLEEFVLTETVGATQDQDQRHDPRGQSELLSRRGIVPVRAARRSGRLLQLRTDADRRGRSHRRRRYHRSNPSMAGSMRYRHACLYRRRYRARSRSELEGALSMRSASRSMASGPSCRASFGIERCRAASGDDEGEGQDAFANRRQGHRSVHPHLRGAAHRIFRRFRRRKIHPPDDARRNARASTRSSSRWSESAAARCASSWKGRSTPTCPDRSWWCPPATKVR